MQKTACFLPQTEWEHHKNHGCKEETCGYPLNPFSFRYLEVRGQENISKIAMLTKNILTLERVLTHFLTYYHGMLVLMESLDIFTVSYDISIFSVALELSLKESLVVYDPQYYERN